MFPDDLPLRTPVPFPEYGLDLVDYQYENEQGRILTLTFGGDEWTKALIFPLPNIE